MATRNETAANNMAAVAAYLRLRRTCRGGNRFLHTAPPTDTLADLTRRGLLQAVTHDTLSQHLQKPRHVYIGIDPTANSLHLGNMLVLSAVKHLQLAGHTPICLVSASLFDILDYSG